jgi:hypothetical protein
MPAIPTITITVQDNGASAAQSVPQQNVQLKIGCAIGGTVNQPYATSSLVSCQTQWIGGPLVEASGLVCQQGNIVVGMSCPIVTAGTATAVQATTPGGGTSAVTVTLDALNGAWDTFFVKVVVVTGGTVGTNGCVVQVSLDAGRTYGAPIYLGTSTALYLGTGTLTSRLAGGTGVQVNFGAGSLVAGDFYTFSTFAPQWTGAGVAAALTAFQASAYGQAGVGSIHIVGDAMHGGSGVADIVTISNAVQAGTAVYQYQRAIVELRDVLHAGGLAYSGTASETEATWIAALQTATSGLTSSPRICADGGAYNTPSAFANAAGGTPAYRRNLAWAHAVRRTQIPLQQRAARVKGGPLANILVNAATDPGDGFVYHNELTTPGLAAARVGAAQTWPKKGSGFYYAGQEWLLSAPGSQLVELVIGNVVDVACDIGYAAGVDEVSDDLLLQSNGTLDPIALNVMQQNIQNALNEGMIQTPLVSSVTATVNPLANVGATGSIPIAIAVQPLGLVNAIVETITVVNGVA